MVVCYAEWVPGQEADESAVRAINRRLRLGGIVWKWLIVLSWIVMLSVMKHLAGVGEIFRCRSG